MKTRRTSSWRRGEGHTEYVILVAMLLICAFAAFVAMTDGLRDAYQTAKVCVDCPLAMSMEELEAREDVLEDKEVAGTLTPEEEKELKEIRDEILRRDEKEDRTELEDDLHNSEDADTSWWANYFQPFVDMFSWWGGGRYWWELFGFV